MVSLNSNKSNCCQTQGSESDPLGHTLWKKRTYYHPADLVVGEEKGVVGSSPCHSDAPHDSPWCLLVWGQGLLKIQFQYSIPMEELVTNDQGISSSPASLGRLG